jgi:serine/threonine-protein kinase RsbW
MSAEPGDGAQHGELSELLDRSVAADAEAIATVVDTISEILVQMDVPEQKRFEIALAVQEALANAVVHGCGNDPTKQVHCQLKADPQGRILICVADPGTGFSPDHVPDPKRQEQTYADHGRGVYLIRQLMDEVHFEHSGNEIRMWKY